MRKVVLGMAAAAALLIGPVSAFSQSIEFGPGGVRFNDGRRGGGSYCEQLRRACERKDELGETGQGNCRRYREECAPRPSRAEVCRQLRYECLNKEDIGATGEGTCRRYRQTCRGY